MQNQSEEIMSLKHYYITIWYKKFIEEGDNFLKKWITTSHFYVISCDQNGWNRSSQMYKHIRKYDNKHNYYEGEHFVSPQTYNCPTCHKKIKERMIPLSFDLCV